MRDGSKQIFKFWYVACVTWANCSVKTWIPTMFAKHHDAHGGTALEIRLMSKYTLPLELLIYRWFAGMFHNVPVFSCDKLWLQGAMLSNQQHFTLMTVRPWIVLTANLGRKSSSSPKLFLRALELSNFGGSWSTCLEIIIDPVAVVFMSVGQSRVHTYIQLYHPN